jgi:TolA-binding protein
MGPIYFTLGAAYLNLQDYAAAANSYARYQQDYPQGPHFEETVYRPALGSLS